MARCVLGVMLLLIAGLPMAARAEGAPDPTEGHRLFSQNCSVCHLLPQITSKRRYGPALDNSIVTPDQEPALHELIATGTQNMPGFRYDLAPAQIDAILAYLATVPPAPAPKSPAKPAAGNGGDTDNAAKD